MCAVKTAQRHFRILILTFLFAQFASAGVGIQGTAHDFSAANWSGGEICGVCHSAHNSNATVPGAPLWNHALTTQTFIPYTSATLKATVGQPGGASKLCLSCHDGTVALDAFSGQPGTAARIANPIGPDLNGQGHWGHPVSFVYDTALSEADDNLNDPVSATTALGSTVQQDLLSNGKVECTSCHDVHNKLGNRVLLKITDENDTLCMSCHKVGL